MTKTFALFLAVVSLAAGADIAGSWTFAVVRFGDEMNVSHMDLEVSGASLSGTLNNMKISGRVQGSTLTFTVKRPNGDTFATLEGRLEGDQMKGTGKRGDMDVTWIARRAAASNAPPQTHSFEPTQFHRYFSGTIAPVLTIRPGDTVRTSTVDAGGRDAHGKARSNGGNPETGPFFVQGALPGDTLVVHLNRVRLNRDSAESGSRITPDALNSFYQRNAKFDDEFSSEWTLDRDKGFAMLSKPSEHLKNFRVKLQPMLGCIAVAPPDKQTFRSGWLGSYGGNMDYNGMREGTTLYLPVYQEGALLFVGDGHAAQGDGELTGDALETSMDVEFTVNLIRGQSTGAPRAENDEYIMAMGIANSLPDAVRNATTGLARWLEVEYKLTPNESAIVLGTSIQYNVAELVDPQVHIVAKVSKAVLATLR